MKFLNSERMAVFTFLLGAVLIHYGCGSPNPVPVVRPPVPAVVPGAQVPIAPLPVLLPACIPLDSAQPEQKIYFPTAGMKSLVLSQTNVLSTQAIVTGQFFYAFSATGSKIKVDSNAYGEFTLGAQTKSYILKDEPTICVNQISFDFSSGPGNSWVYIYMNTPKRNGIYYGIDF
jgi:hypothetical protein